jgi:hypothetical protein
MNPDSFRTTSTSRLTADSSPLVLREGPQSRLVFIPTLVNNAKDAAAAVSGTFVWQKKKRADVWEDVPNVPLTTLRAGEGYKLELHTKEVLAFLHGLKQLYALVQARGVPMGTQEWFPVPKSSIAADMEVLLSDPSRPIEQQTVVRAFVKWLRQRNIPELLAQLEPAGISDLVSFDAAFQSARLRAFLTEAEGMLNQGFEPAWQAKLEEHNWVLSQVYAYPFVIVAGQGYVGGKGISNAGGNLVDAIYRNTLTMNALLVEIKHPLTALVTQKKYRNNVHGATEDLAGAVAQILQNRQSLIEQYHNLRRDDDEDDVKAWNPRALLVAGRADQLTGAQRRSFELFRASLRDVDVVTFDELISKAKALLDLVEGSA